MKKITLIAILIAAFHVGSLQAQTEKGKIMVGLSTTQMNFGFFNNQIKSDSDSLDEGKTSESLSVNFSPKVGYFFIDNLCLGVDVDLNWQKNKDEASTYVRKYTTFKAGPFVRYYVPMNNVLPFAEINSSFGYFKQEFENDEVNSDYGYQSNVTSFGGGLGLAAPLGKRVTFDVLAGYNSTTSKLKENNDDNTRYNTGSFNFKLGFTLFLGAQ